MTEIIKSGDHLAIIDRHARSHPAKDFAAIGNISSYHTKNGYKDHPTWTGNMRVYSNKMEGQWTDIPMNLRFPVYIFINKHNDRYTFEIL